jgi:hypothetical protein
MNRVGDWALSLGFLLTIALTADLSFATIFSLAPYLNTDLILILALLLLVGASAKSAQLGLHSWLASAMEGFTGKQSLTRKTGKDSSLKDLNWEACIGLMIGDGYCSKLQSLTSNSRMQFSFREKWFVEWLQFTVFCFDGKDTRFCTGKIQPHTSKSGAPHYFLKTRQLPVFTKLRLLFYNVKGTKVLTPASLSFFSPISLAYLLMSDGYWDKTIHICTENFDRKSVQLLVFSLRKLGVICTLKKRGEGFRIRLSSRGTNLAHVRK